MRRLPYLLLILAIAALLAFVSAPWFALRSLQTAARDGDVQTLAELIDYPAVRAGLRAHARPEDMGPVPTLWSDPLGAMRRAWDDRLPATPDVERRLTPGGLYAITGPPTLWPSVRHWSPDRVRYGVRTEAGLGLLTFKRKGVFKWTLIQLSPPPVSATVR